MPAYQDTFSDITLEGFPQFIEDKKASGARFVDLHATTIGDKFLLNYAFTDDEIVTNNYRMLIDADAKVPSITDSYLCAFFFENETHDLFGVDFEGIAIDFQGNFYQVSLEAPMSHKSEPSDMYSVNREFDAMDPVKKTKDGER